MNTQAVPLQLRPRKNSYWPMLAGMAAGALCGGLIGWFLKAQSPLHLSPSIIMALPLIALLSLALHEAGHVAAGLSCGFEFLLFVVGPLRLERYDGRLKVAFNRIPMLWGGIAACVPKSYAADLHRRMILFAAGGPAFSLLGAAFTIPGFFLLRTHGNAGFLLLALGLMSAAIALITLLPVHAGGFKSDGMRLAMLLRRMPEGERWTALAALGGIAQTARPRDWPVELMALLGDGLDGQTDAVLACLLRHIWHSDKREFTAAQRWLERALSQTEVMPAATRPILYLAAARHYARWDADHLLARQYFDLARGPGLHDTNDLHAVHAAVLIAEGRPSEAQTELDIAEQKLGLKPPAIAQWLREDIGELRGLIG